MYREKEKYKSGEKSLTKNEYDALLKTIPTISDELLIKLAVATGIRREDIVNIKIADINFDENYLTFLERKKKRISKVYISDELKLLITKHLNTLPKGQEHLFDFSGRTAYNKLNHYCEIANIPKRPFHALRATCIKFAQANGWSMEQTAKHIGDTIRTIQLHYSTPSSSEMAEVAKTKAIA